MARRQAKYVVGARRDEVIGVLLRDLRKLPRNKDYMVTIERLAEPISDGQRKLFWVWMQIMADELGFQSKEEAYEDGFKYSGILAGRGISELSMDEMSDLMTATQHWFMSELDITLPSSHNEYYEYLEAETIRRGG